MSSDALPPPVGAGAPPPPPGPAPAPPKTVRSWTTAQLKRTLRVANLCNGVTLIALGIIVFIIGMTTVSFTSVTVSVYTCFFGLLLSCLECNISNLAPRLQRNFGFMFSFTGRTLFIVFCGSMAFAMGNWLSYVVGALTVLNGLFNGYVICVHPAFKTGELSARGDPYGGYSGGEKEMLTYLQSKPELARQAQGAAVSFAAQNPQAAMSIVQAASAKPAGGHV